MDKTDKKGEMILEQTVYVDLLFLVNFSMDFLCLFLTSRLLSRQLSLPRALLAAILGGAYAIAELILIPETLTGVLLDVGVCILMCFIAFFSKGERLISLLVLFVSYILASALLGGIMTASFSLLNRYSPTVSSGNADIPVWIFCLITVLSTLATLLGGRHMKKRATTAAAQIEIFFDGRSVTLRAMCDSGNLLRDSISGKPVLIADTRAAAPLFFGKYPLANTWEPQTLSHLPKPLAERVRLVPTSSVGGDRLMVALRPDKILLRDQHGTHSADALVGFAELHCALRDCKALIPPELLA